MAKAKRWLCKIHDVECSYGHPCYACKQEIRDPKSIESEKLNREVERQKNAQPRLEEKELTKAVSLNKI